MAQRTRPTQSPTAERHLHHCGLGHARSASIACNCFNNRNDAAPERAELLFFSPKKFLRFGELAATAPSSRVPPPLRHDTFAVVARNDGESYHDHPLPALILRQEGRVSPGQAADQCRPEHHGEARRRARHPLHRHGRGPLLREAALPGRQKSAADARGGRRVREGIRRPPAGRRRARALRGDPSHPSRALAREVRAAGRHVMLRVNESRQPRGRT